MNASRVVSSAVLAAVLGLSPGALAQVHAARSTAPSPTTSGAVLPGATVQLTSAQTGAREAVAGSQGEFRFENLDPGEYNLRVTLAGFTPYVRERVIVGVGTSVELKMEMAVAGVQEEVRVTAETPMLDTRTQGNVANFDQAMLNEVPTARDPWVLLQFVPGVQLDRINVGGSESGQQSVFSARGDDGSNTMWNIDGVTITDPAAIGSSPTYYDFSTFDEVQFTTSGQDPRQQTGGLGINFVTKRGTNDFRGQARLYFTNDDLQDTNIPSDLAALGFRGNGIDQIAEYGGDIGGPILRDRVWFWGAWAKNDIRQVAITGTPDDTELNNTSAKVNAQLARVERVQLLLLPGREDEARSQRGRHAAARDDVEPDRSDEHLQVRGLARVRAGADAVREVRVRRRRLLVRAAGRDGRPAVARLRRRQRQPRQLLPVRHRPPAVPDQRGRQLVHGRTRGAVRVPVPPHARQLAHPLARKPDVRRS